MDSHKFHLPLDLTKDHLGDVHAYAYCPYIANFIIYIMVYPTL